MTANWIEGLAERGAGVMHAAFRSYRPEFNAITRRAKVRFERRDWHGMQDVALERLELYKKIVDRTVAETQAVLGEAVRHAPVWVQMKACYSRSIAGYGDVEIAETFFNSITRRIFATVGVDPGREYVDSDFSAPPARSLQPVNHTYLPERPTAEWLQQVMAERGPRVRLRQLVRDRGFGGGRESTGGDVGEKLQLFNVEEANRLLTEIRPRFERLVEAKREFHRVRTRMEILGIASAG